MSIMTRAQFVSYIEEEYPRTDKGSFIITCLDDTLYDLTTEYDFEIIESEATVSLVADTSEYSFPTIFTTAIGEIKYLDANGDGFILNKLTKSQFDNRWPDLTASDFNKDEPQDYTIYGDNIVIAPFPDTVTTESLLVPGATIATKLSFDSSQPQFEDEWREVIKRGVLARLYEATEDFGLADRQYALYQRGIEKMKRVDKSKSEAFEFVSYRGF